MNFFLVSIVAVILPHTPVVVSSSHRYLRHKATHRKDKEENFLSQEGDGGDFWPTDGGDFWPTDGGDWPTVEFWPSTKSVNRQARIIGGVTADNDDYPYYVQWDGCGASLIGKNVLLTAAHCLNRQRLDPTVWIGAYHSIIHDGLQRRVTGVALHPDYQQVGSSVSYDFALLVLGEPVTESGIEPVPLNRDSSHPKLGVDQLTVIGMGLSEYDSEKNTGKYPDKLQELKVPYVPHDACVQDYGFYNVSIDETSQFCGGGQGFEDACRGDSGGPVLDEDGVQVGVVSFGVKCGDGGWPSVYSRISSVVDWIDDFLCLNAESDSDCPESQTTKRFLVNVTIQPDNFPHEISWGVWKRGETRGDNDNLLYVPYASIQNVGMYTKTLLLSPGTYKFEIRDSAADGLCCDFGEGGYNITSGEDSLERRGEYKNRDFVEFVVSDSGRLWDAQLVQLRVDITYDNRPTETAWRLDNLDNNEKIYISKFGDVVTPGLISYSFSIPRGKYWMVIIDFERNGICCENGEGSVKIYKVVDGNDELVATIENDFSWRADVEFELP